VIVGLIVTAVTGVEVAALHFLAAAFIHNGVARSIVEWTVNVATVAFMAAFLSGARGRVTVSQSTVRVSFGLMGGTEFPRSAIATVSRFGADLATRGWIGCQLLQDGRAYYSLSGDGDFVEFRLAQPARVRYLFWKTGETTTIVVSASMSEWPAA
jgi:hypothetical protein